MVTLERGFEEAWFMINLPRGMGLMVVLGLSVFLGA
jgi:hypothetical protein